VDEQKKQTILDPAKVIAVGIASPIATILTSRFGVAGTLLGLALSAIILTVLSDVLKVYLARAPATVAKMPGSFRAGISWQDIRGRLGAALDSFSALAPARRRSILVGSVIAGGISFFVGLSVVTGVEFSVGKSLSCWVWGECPTESSTDGGEAASKSTLPSILGGGRSASSSTPQVEPLAPEQQPGPKAPESPSQARPDVSGWENTPDRRVPDEQRSPSEEPQWSQSEESQWYPPEESQRNPTGGLEERQPEDQQQVEDREREKKQLRRPAVE
jgi:hypothetical protein